MQARAVGADLRAAFAATRFSGQVAAPALSNRALAASGNRKSTAGFAMRRLVKRLSLDEMPLGACYPCGGDSSGRRRADRRFKLAVDENAFDGSFHLCHPSPFPLYQSAGRCYSRLDGILCVSYVRYR